MAEEDPTSGVYGSGPGYVSPYAQSSGTTATTTSGSAPAASATDYQAYQKSQLALLQKYQDLRKEVADKGNKYTGVWGDSGDMYFNAETGAYAAKAGNVQGQSSDAQKAYNDKLKQMAEIKLQLDPALQKFTGKDYAPEWGDTDQGGNKNDNSGNVLHAYDDPKGVMAEATKLAASGGLSTTPAIGSELGDPNDPNNKNIQKMVADATTLEGLNKYNDSQIRPDQVKQKAALGKQYPADLFDQLIKFRDADKKVNSIYGQMSSGTTLATDTNDGKTGPHWADLTSAQNARLAAASAIFQNPATAQAIAPAGPTTPAATTAAATTATAATTPVVTDGVDPTKAQPVDLTGDTQSSPNLLLTSTGKPTATGEAAVKSLAALYQADPSKITDTTLRAKVATYVQAQQVADGWGDKDGVGSNKAKANANAAETAILTYAQTAAQNANNTSGTPALLTPDGKATAAGDALMTSLTSNYASDPNSISDPKLQGLVKTYVDAANEADAAGNPGSAAYQAALGKVQKAEVDILQYEQTKANSSLSVGGVGSTLTVVSNPDAKKGEVGTFWNATRLAAQTQFPGLSDTQYDQIANLSWKDFVAQQSPDVQKMKPTEVPGGTKLVVPDLRQILGKEADLYQANHLDSLYSNIKKNFTLVA